MEIEIKNLLKIKGNDDLLLINSPVFYGFANQLREVLKSQQNKSKNLKVIIKSPGGSPDEAYRAMKSLLSSYDSVVMIPLWAKSAATLMALGATQVIMCDYSELGPIDTQVRKESENDIEASYDPAIMSQESLKLIMEMASQNFFDMYSKSVENPQIRISRKQLAESLLSYSARIVSPILDKIDPYELGKMLRYANMSFQYATKMILSHDRNPETRSQLAELGHFLAFGCTDHGIVIDYDDVREFVKTDFLLHAKDISPEMNEDLKQLTSEIDAIPLSLAFIEEGAPKGQTKGSKGDKNEQSQGTQISDK